MKYLYLILLLALLTSCRKNKYAEITGTTNGFTSGTMVIRDQDGRIKFSGDIEDGKFDFHLTVDTIGYYSMRIINMSAEGIRHPGYDFYLEPGKYTIVAQPENARQYPQITSTSDIQTSLSQYYDIANPLNAESAKDFGKYTAVLYDKNATDDDKGKAHEERNKIFAAESQNNIKALQEYVAKYPQNNVEAHIMAQLDYDSNPDECYPIYQKFTDEQKKSPEGVEEGEKLAGLMNLAPGNAAPQIAGTTPDGKPFDPKSVQGKITLVEFWTSDNELSKDNHNTLLFNSFSPLKTYNNFTIVSVSLDSVAKPWKDAVKAGGLTWTNISDLKGMNSPNVKNWQISKIPTYMLVDANWKIIKRDVNFGDLPSVMQDYTDKGKSK
jgi:hypothetical protein